MVIFVISIKIDNVCSAFFKNIFNNSRAGQICILNKTTVLSPFDDDKQKTAFARIINSVLAFKKMENHGVIVGAGAKQQRKKSLPHNNKNDYCSPFLVSYDFCRSIMYIIWYDKYLLGEGMQAAICVMHNVSMQAGDRRCHFPLSLCFKKMLQ